MYRTFRLGNFIGTQQEKGVVYLLNAVSKTHPLFKFSQLLFFSSLRRAIQPLLKSCFFSNHCFIINHTRALCKGSKTINFQENIFAISLLVPTTCSIISMCSLARKSKFDFSLNQISKRQACGVGEYDYSEILS